MSRTKWSNQNKETDGARRNAYPERSGNPLSAVQKAKICVLAGQAAAARSLSFSSAKAADAWRKGEMERACGLDSLTRCSQEHYLVLVAHFQDLAGESGAAFVSAMAHGTEAARVALNKLTEACAKAGLPLAYAQTVCRRQYGVELDDATKEQLWRVTFTIKNRAGNKRKAAAKKPRKTGSAAAAAEPQAEAEPDSGDPF